MSRIRNLIPKMLRESWALPVLLIGPLLTTCQAPSQQVLDAGAIFDGSAGEWVDLTRRRVSTGGGGLRGNGGGVVLLLL
jgi:hypothetical protein